jgi:hypothetical protein
MISPVMSFDKENTIAMETRGKSETKKLEEEISKIIKEDVLYTIKSIHRCGQEQIIKKKPAGSRFYDIMKLT